MQRAFYGVIAIVVLLFIGAAIYMAEGSSWQKLFFPSTADSIPTASFLPETQQAELVDVAATDNSPQPVLYKVEKYITGLNVPWSIVFTSPTRILVTERPGKVRVIINGQLQPRAIKEFPETVSQSEEGLMGLTLHPQYATNRFVYISLAYQKNEAKVVKVLRFIDTGNSLENELLIIDDIPAANNHAGNRLHFGPDIKLYISTGDAQQPESAQDSTALSGKFLRLNDDGSIPSDNPIPDSPVYTWGHRNPQGFAWHPVTGELYATEHGPSRNDGPPGGDEVNLIGAGENYGWPRVSHDRNDEGFVAPLLVFTPAVAPAGAAFYDADVFPQLKNSFLFAMLRGEGIMRVIFDENEPKKVVRYEKLPDINVGRVREIVTGPDGYIYFATSNRDGRGTPRDG
ncbi:MAG: PQQ-dependent sugar dehydrogenase, partial [bacterium]|nr:PQQ-dependent sugar dehydrogenase [bacterium]